MYPALAVAASILKQQPSAAAARASLLYVGRANSIEERLARHAQIPFESIEVGGVRGLAPWTAAKNLWRVYRSIGRVRALIRSFQPDVIFATGGYVSAPVIWAGAAEKVPSVIYLPDLEPGWAIRATARWATKIAISFPEVARHFTKGKTVVTGYPVRQAFFLADQKRARQKFNLAANAHTITIFGGSQGAHHINSVAGENLAELAQMAQLIFITGRNDEAWMNEQVETFRRNASTTEASRIRVFGYLDDDLPDALAAADVVIARAGAATLGEFPALGLPAILVPYPFAGKHQERNADFLIECGAAIKLDDAKLETDLLPTIRRLFDAPEQLNKLGDAMRALSQPNAAENIVTLLEKISQGKE